MKVAVVSDTHFGMKRGSDIFLESQLKFFKEQFIPELKEKKIDTILHLGDFFDNRVSIDSKIMSAVLDLFQNDLKDFKIHILVGNHDSYLESSIHINSIKTLSYFSNVTVYNDVESIELGGRRILMCPWVTNVEEFSLKLDTYGKHDICAGHFDIARCKMFKNQESEHGIDSSVFLSRFKITMSGHFHTRSVTKLGLNELIYFGNPYHMTRNDIDDERGYMILNLKTMKYEFINNEKSLKFISVKYPNILTEEDVKGNHVDVVVEYNESYNENEIQSYLDKLESYEPAFPIVTKTINKINVDNPDEIEINSIQDLITEYLNNVEISSEYRPTVKSLFQELYSECSSEI